MKLWKKLSFVIIMVMLLTTGISGYIILQHTFSYNQKKTIESYEKQLRTTAYALARELDKSFIQEYREMTKNAYLNYLMKKFGMTQYILLEDNKVAYNLTPFEFTHSHIEQFEQENITTVIQKTDTQYILITGKRIPYIGEHEYGLLLVEDISELYEDMKRQLCFYIGLGIVTTIFAVILVFGFTKRILRPLKELELASKDISQGNLERRVTIISKDEVGMVAEAFNYMADKVEQQMHDIMDESEKRKQMLGSLTHELKTPMTSIIGYADTLLHVNVRKEQQEIALMHIYEESRRLERLSGKLMNLIGMYDNDSIHLECVSMMDIFERVVRLEKENLLQKGIHIECFCDMKDRMADSDLLESMLINLIDNAVKASKEGMTIWVTGHENVIMVKDEGCGIPKEELSHVAEAFYMVDKVRSRKSGGCGLGLALCNQIAQLHHATISINSKLGEGTAVTVTFDEERY